MSGELVNPILPLNEYIPDGEPRLFDNKIYIYGSHDRFNGHNFCLEDYVTYSIDINSFLSHYEGVIFKKSDDRQNKRKKPLYAPDCIKGIDGKYYLYYSVAYSGIIGVASSLFPSGPFKFLDYVHYKDGTILGNKKGDIFHFDPGLFIENEEVYLYSGFAPLHYPFFLTGGKNITKIGPQVIKLEKDMVTIKENPKYFGVPTKRNSKGTGYENHEFFEASSLRKIKGKYYFIYSSFNGYELCYAISDYPDKDFKYGGVIVALGDIGLNKIKNKKNALNYLGNTHGSILELNNNYYIFYHRQTNRNCFSRQACVEKINIDKDGLIKQVEMTSLGFNTYLSTKNKEFNAAIACNLRSKRGVKFYSVFKVHDHPYFTQDCNRINYIANIKDGTLIGYKYFKFEDKHVNFSLFLKASKNNGIFEIYSNKKLVGKIKVFKTKDLKYFGTELYNLDKTGDITLVYKGKGKISLRSIKFSYE